MSDEPREFYINFGMSNGTHVRTPGQYNDKTFPLDKDYQSDAIHVIEKTPMIEAAEEMFEALDLLVECYGHCFTEDRLNKLETLMKKIRGE